MEYPDRKESPWKSISGLRSVQIITGMFQHRFDLRARYTFKPLEEIIHTGASRKILEQSSHGDARISEEPGSAYLARNAFHC